MKKYIILIILISVIFLINYSYIDEVDALDNNFNFLKNVDTVKVLNYYKKNELLVLKLSVLNSSIIENIDMFNNFYTHTEKEKDTKLKELNNYFTVFDYILYKQLNIDNNVVEIFKLDSTTFIFKIYVSTLKYDLDIYLNEKLENQIIFNDFLNLNYFINNTELFIDNNNVLLKDIAVYDNTLYLNLIINKEYIIEQLKNKKNSILKISNDRITLYTELYGEGYTKLEDICNKENWVLYNYGGPNTLITDFKSTNEERSEFKKLYLFIININDKSESQEYILKIESNKDIVINKKSLLGQK